jgi:hypothetical protein
MATGYRLPATAKIISGEVKLGFRLGSRWPEAGSRT